MKVVISSTGNSIDSTFDKRFGRAAWFCFFDDDTNKTEFIENKFANENSGAGAKVAELMVESHVAKVISGDFGPKAKDVLEKFDVQMVVVQDLLSVGDIINKLKK